MSGILNQKGNIFKKYFRRHCFKFRNMFKHLVRNAKYKILNFLEMLYVVPSSCCMFEKGGNHFYVIRPWLIIRFINTVTFFRWSSILPPTPPFTNPLICKKKKNYDFKQTYCTSTCEIKN